VECSGRGREKETLREHKDLFIYYVNTFMQRLRRRVVVEEEEEEELVVVVVVVVVVGNFSFDTPATNYLPT